MSEVYVSMDTSHGNQTIKCKVELRRNEIEVSDDNFDFDTYWKAKLVFGGLSIRWHWMQELTKKIATRWRASNC